MATEQSIVLITGANSGIGLELAVQLLADPSKHVILCSRSLEKGQKALEDVKAFGKPGTVELLQLDVSDEASIKSAAKTVEEKHGRLDALVNNAAIGGVSVDGPIVENFKQTFVTNVIGTYLMVEAFQPLLSNSIQTPRIINVSSGGGSMTRRLDPSSLSFRTGMWGLPYTTSKAALNYITAAQATVYGTRSPDSDQVDPTKPYAKGNPFKVFTYTPGFTVSNLGPHNNVESGASPTSEGAAPMVKILNGERDDEHACFLSKNGQYAW